jgi:hypothetical protein
MQEAVSINELFCRYSQKKIAKRQFEEILFEKIIKNYDQYHRYRWKRDEYIDYLCWFYPRFSRAIDHYRDTGSSFEAYIGTMIRWSAKEYHTLQTNHRIIERAAWISMAADMPGEDQGDGAARAIRPSLRAGTEVCSERPEYPGVSQAKFVNPKQILILVLKSYFFISDDFLDRIAPFIGIEKEKLKELVDKLRVLRMKRDDSIRGLQERIGCQFYRCITYEHRLAYYPKNSPRHFTVTQQLARARKRLHGMRARLARMRLEATNLQVAGVLGIAKGTVDANIHAMRSGMDSRKALPFPDAGDMDTLNYT